MAWLFAALFHLLMGPADTPGGPVMGHVGYITPPAVAMTAPSEVLERSSLT